MITVSLVIAGIKRNASLLKISEEDVPYILEAVALDKPSITKCLLKSLYWALTLANCKYILLQQF